MDFIGPMLDSDVAMAIANGDMDPITMKRFPIQALPPRRSSIQPSAPHGSQKALPPPVKPKAAITSFFHASESAAAAVFNAPRSNPASSKRKLPPSFMDKWTSKASSPEDKSARAVDNDAVAKAAATNELVKKSTPRSVDPSSTYQSQEPRGVDVARNISFEPMTEKAKSVPVVQGDCVSKENQAPNSQETPSNPVPQEKETAFSRMMRAGSMLQQHKLKKRKISGPGFRSGKLRAAHQTPLSSCMEQFAFTGNAKVDTPPSTSCTLSAEQLKGADSASNHANYPEVTPATVNSEDPADIVSKSMASTPNKPADFVIEGAPKCETRTTVVFTDPATDAIYSEANTLINVDAMVNHPLPKI
ncbi:hypothetical protein ON010_g2002 [Phytophthora cinnamomi]|nr:hypothetical protein ON010_g2002 [Phytophthora cinnamomi]